MIHDIKEINFPEYATLDTATVSLSDMGEKTITATVKIDGQIAPDFSYDWIVEFQGERYVHPLRKPQASKENTSLLSQVELTFKHWAIHELSRYFFFAFPSTDSGTAIADKYIAPLSLTLPNFIVALNKVLDYYYGGKIRAEIYSGWQASDEPTTLSISYTYIWDLITKIYDNFGVRWQLATDPEDSSVCVIQIGFPTTELSHIFEYGFDGGLLKLEQQVQSSDIKNILLGRGGDKNLPYRYFKDVDPDNPAWPADPDWIPELKNIYFSELRDSAFRSYVQGWKYRHYDASKTRDKAAVKWAWDKGYNDGKFAPVEYVYDEESIAQYGELWGGLENNEEIYPTIQGVTIGDLGRIDEIVAVEEILTDDIKSVGATEVQTTNIPAPPSRTQEIALPPWVARMPFTSGEFEVPEGKTANLIIGSANFICSTQSVTFKLFDTVHELVPSQILNSAYATVTVDSIEILNTSGTVIAGLTTTAIPSGKYKYRVWLSIKNNYTEKINITVEMPNATLQIGQIQETKWQDVFCVWVKNIWNTEMSGVDAKKYAEKVWSPILGDRIGDSAAMVFSSGFLSISEDYEFIIAAMPEYDTSKTLVKRNEAGNVIATYTSHWKITLAKSDAEYETTGLYLPNTRINAAPGDHFFFTGIDMPYMYYTEAEKRLTAYKQDQLELVSDIKPIRVVTLDKVRINNKQEDEIKSLASQFKLGASLRIADKRFIFKKGKQPYEIQYIQNITYTYQEAMEGSPNILPEINIVLSDSYSTTANPVATIQGEIRDLAKQVGSISNIEQIVRAVGDRVYLRKDGIEDRSYSPTSFSSLLKSLDFRKGEIGGKGWAFFKDDNNNWTLETDRINVRQEMQVNNLVINQITARGGMIIESAAQIEVTRVEETNSGYMCFFDQKQGSVANLFHIDDVAYSHVFSADNISLKFYKRRIVAIDSNSITLTKGYRQITLPDGSADTGVNGAGVPEEGDVIVHFGNYTDKTRQYVKIRDVVGGGYERYLMELDSVNASGKEYYFVGKQDGETPKLFMGDKDRDYLLWQDGQLNIKGRISVESSVGDTSFNDYVNNLIGVNADNLEEKVNEITGSKFENFKTQIDGKVESWFQEEDPSKNWKEESEKAAHDGDMWYNTTSKELKYFRVDYNDRGAVIGTSWEPIEDAKTIKAYETALAAQSAANSKKQIFSDTPYPPYEVNDLWLRKDDEWMICIKRRAEGEFNALDWDVATDYYDNTKTTIDGGIVTSGTIQVAGDTSRVLAGMTGEGYTDDSVRFWAGATKVNRDKAPFRVYQSGAFVASNANITGNIIARTGKIGNLGINGNELIGYNDKNVPTVRLGVGNLPSLNETETIHRTKFLEVVVYRDFTNYPYAAESTLSVDNGDPNAAENLYSQETYGFRMGLKFSNKLNGGAVLSGSILLGSVRFYTRSAASVSEFRGITVGFSGENILPATFQWYVYVQDNYGNNYGEPKYYDMTTTHATLTYEALPSSSELYLRIGIKPGQFTAKGYFLFSFSIMGAGTGYYIRERRTSGEQSVIIASDGLLSMKDGSNYFEYRFGQGFKVISGNVGFRVTSAGVEVIKNGGWVRIDT